MEDYAASDHQHIGFRWRERAHRATDEETKGKNRGWIVVYPNAAKLLEVMATKFDAENLVDRTLCLIIQGWKASTRLSLLDSRWWEQKILQ